MTESLARIIRSSVKSLCCLILAFSFLIGFTNNAWALGGIAGSTWTLERDYSREQSFRESSRNPLEISFGQNDFLLKGCRSYAGTYTADVESQDDFEITGSIQLKSIREVGMSCPPGAIESSIVDVLKTATRYSIRNYNYNTLSLFGEGNIFTFISRTRRSN
ncbi:MAG: hypothetical protein ACRCT1_07750 [Microcoleaceae cyanobacterium]